MKSRYLVLAVLTAVVGSACSTTSGSSTTSTATTVSATTVADTVTTSSPEVAPCLAGEQPFAVDGALASGLLDGNDGDAEMVSGLRWTAYDGCERLVVELATSGGAPATEAGGVRAELLRDRGIIRLRFDDRVASTSIADRVVEGGLVDAVYVVRSLAGYLFADLHLGSGVLARASIRRSPAEVVVDLQAAADNSDVRPLAAENAVVVNPVGGMAGYPLVVTGYARTFEANVVMRLRQGNRLDVEATTTAADYLTTWGEYRFEVEEGPRGRVEVFVGEDAPQDGRERGVSFNLVMG